MRIMHVAYVLTLSTPKIDGAPTNPTTQNPTHPQNPSPHEDPSVPCHPHPHPARSRHHAKPAPRQPIPVNQEVTTSSLLDNVAQKYL